AATVLVSLYAVTLGRCFFGHYFTLGVVGLSLWTVLGAHALATVVESSGSAVRGWVTLLVLALAVSQVSDRYEKERTAVHHMDPYIGTGSTVTRDIVDRVVRYSAPTDRVATDGSPGLYVLANRRSATKESAFLDEFLILYPGNTDEERLAFL